MKAIRIHALGGPEVVSFEEAPRPEPRHNELLVRVAAAGVNPVDWKIREGHLGHVALPAILGTDFSGVIEGVGSDVHEFQVGESVFGSVADDSGSFAEYATAPVARVSRKPDVLDDVHAAAVPVASLTAWQAIFDTAHLVSGQTVLIHAAAGGVGSFAVQFAKQAGAYVIGTASAQKTDYVRKLGADEVIDYRATRFEEKVANVDVVFDTLGADTQERSWKVLKPGGILVSIVQPPPPEQATARSVRSVFMICDHDRGDQLAHIADLVVHGRIKVHVAECFTLEETTRALTLSQSGHVQGKIVLHVP